MTVCVGAAPYATAEGQAASISLPLSIEFEGLGSQILSQHRRLVGGAPVSSVLALEVGVGSLGVND